MAQFQRTRPTSEVQKLKGWGPARIAQLKIFLSHLESAFNTSLAAQVLQSPKRKFSEFVPKIVPQDVNVEVEYRELRVTFAPPKGLRNFLIYEAVISTTENFASFDLFRSPDPFFVFPNLLDGTTYYLRMRVVDKDGNFGPWSDTETASTPFSQAYGLKDGTEFAVLVFGADFTTIFSRDYTAIGGKAYYSIDYEFGVQISGDSSNNVEWTDVEFQWFVDSDQVGQNFLISAYSVNNTATSLGTDMEVITDVGTFGSNSLFLPGPFRLKRRGTFIQKFTTIASGDQTISLKARIVNPHPTPNDFDPNPANTAIVYGSRAVIRLKNFNIFETLVS